MKKNFLILCSILCVLCFNACIKDKNNTVNSEAVQSKVNYDYSFIVPDNRADKTNKPFTTYSDSRRLILNYWADNMPKMSLNENLFRIDDILKLFRDNEKIVFIVDGIAEKQVKIQVIAYDAVEYKFKDANKSSTYYYILEKAALTRKMPDKFDPDGIMYAETPNGEPVTHLSVTIGTNKIKEQVWFYLFLDAIKVNEFRGLKIELRGPPPGSGLDIPPI